MENSQSEKVAKKTKAAEHPLPWVYEVEMQRKIQSEAYLRAERDGFRNHPHHYWLSTEKDFGCCAP